MHVQAANHAQLRNLQGVVQQLQHLR
jgi:hypothetical protein